MLVAPLVALLAPRLALSLTAACILATRLEQHLNRVLREIKYEERIKTAHAQVALAGAAAGGIIVIGISLSFFGYLPAGTSLLSLGMRERESMCMCVCVHVYVGP